MGRLLRVSISSSSRRVLACQADLRKSRLGQKTGVVVDLARPNCSWRLLTLRVNRLLHILRVTYFLVASNLCLWWHGFTQKWKPANAKSFGL